MNDDRERGGWEGDAKIVAARDGRVSLLVSGSQKWKKELSSGSLSLHSSCSLRDQFALYSCLLPSRNLFVLVLSSCSPVSSLADVRCCCYCWADAVRLLRLRLMTGSAAAAVDAATTSNLCRCRCHWLCLCLCWLRLEMRLIEFQK